MNRSLSDITTSAHFDHHSLIQQHELCRQQSQCYLLAPPPRPPSIPDLFLATTCRLSSLSLSSSTFTNVRQRTESSSPSFLTIISIAVGILIALTSACLILFLLIVKFQCYHKLRHCHRRTTATASSVNSSMRGANNSDVAFIKTTNTNGGDVAGCASFSNVAPTSYGCLTPLTTTTIATNHQYRSLPMTVDSNLSLQMTCSQQNLHLNSDEISSCHHHSNNIYEEIRPSYNPLHRCCCCCSCTLAHYHQQQQHASSNHQLTPHYYTCEPPSATSSVVCQSCLLETLHRKQQHTANCACHNFFVPIK